MTFQDDIQKALLTWYPEGHSLHYDLDHPTMKLAGEAGEILDLYAKHKYKPNFNWWRCRHCKETEGQHKLSHCHYTPLVLDELGDWWYYWRILAYLSDIKDYPNRITINDISTLLSNLNYASAIIAEAYFDIGRIVTSELFNSFSYYNGILRSLNITLERVTKSNYRKLNSEKTNHGWKGA